MNHGVTFRLQRRGLDVGTADVVFLITRNREKLGTLLVSKGHIEWIPRSKKHRRRMRWEKFDEVMREIGRRMPKSQFQKKRVLAGRNPKRRRRRT